MANYGLLFPIFGVAGASVWFAWDTIDGLRRGRYDRYPLGSVSRRTRPRLFRFITFATRARHRRVSRRGALVRLARMGAVLPAVASDLAAAPKALARAKPPLCPRGVTADALTLDAAPSAPRRTGHGRERRRAVDRHHV
jgi:hypothetical protein